MTLKFRLTRRGGNEIRNLGPALYSTSNLSKTASCRLLLIFRQPESRRERPERRASSAVLKVRIHLRPAESLSLSRIRFRRSRTPAFRAGVRGWLSERVGRDDWSE
jgi:hypothetical protein